MAWRGNRSSKAARQEESVPCPHCGAAVRASAAACRDCGYDWTDDEEDAGEDDFDYDAYVADEFGDSQVSTRLRPWQRLVVLILLILFAVTFLWPFL